jgi:predicted O-methyltransferase YrrM
MKGYLKSRFERLFAGFAKRADIDNVYRQLSALLEIKEIVGPAVPIGSLRGWALSPDALLIILRDITARKAPRVVEFGSGESTIAIAAALRSLGEGSLVSIEHDENFSRSVVSKLKLSGLVDRVQTHRAPIRRYEGRLGFSAFESYDLNSADFDFDVAVIDGPIAVHEPSARLIPLEWTLARLGCDGVAYLDDAARPGEKAVICRLRVLFDGIDEEWIDCEKGLLRLKRAGLHGAEAPSR